MGRCRLTTRRHHPAAHDALIARGVPVVPDLLASAGGVIVAYFEWVQNLQRMSRTHDEVRTRTAERLETATASVVERSGRGQGPGTPGWEAVAHLVDAGLLSQRAADAPLQRIVEEVNRSHE